MTEDYILTKMDLRAMREANRVALYYNKDKEEGRNGILCIKVVPNDDPYDDGEKEYWIRCPSDIDTRFNPRAEEYTRGYDMLWSYSTQWKCLLWILRAGDAIRLVWGPDWGTTEYMKQVKLHADVMSMEIRRVRRGKTEKVLLRLAQSCCPSNTARMMKKGKYL